MNAELVSVLQHSGIAVLATDTLYGIVGRADSKEVVERLYVLKGRDEIKPFIILIPSLENLQQFGIALDGSSEEILSKVWPSAVTVILPVQEGERERLQYLHRGTNSLAFRMPDKEKLQELLRVTGPLVAPSANPQGLQPATTIAEAQNYFGNAVDHYEDEGVVIGEPSTIITIENGELTVIRQGRVHLDSK